MLSTSDGFFPQLFCDLGMAVHEVVQVSELTTSYVAIGPVFPAIEALFSVHERVRVLLHLFAHSGVAGQEFLERRVRLDELFVVDQRRVLAQLLGDLGVAVHEAIHVGQLAARDVTIAAVAIPIAIFAPVIALLLMHHGVRILIEIFPDFGMILQVALKIRVSFDELPFVHQRGILANLLGELRMAVEESIERG